MKRLPLLLLVLMLALLACALPTSTPQGVTQTAPASITPTPTNAPEPTATATLAITATPQPNVQCGHISFYLDPALAANFQCETIPEDANPDNPAFGINPEMTHVTLLDYVLGPRFHKPHIDVFPVQRFQEILPDAVNPRLALLNQLLAGTPPGQGALPLLPVFNAAQEFYAKYAVLPFQNGHGIRYITQYNQAYYPVNNYQMFLSFQGLTADGQYWVSLILPISHPTQQETDAMPPNVDWNQVFADANQYYAQKTQELNAQPPDSFHPSLPTVDALIASITVQP
jgi:hypothetical protein